MNKLILARLAAVFTAGVLTACGVTGKSGKNDDFPETTTAEAEPVMMSAQAAKNQSALSAEKHGYGQGVQVDEKNRTTGALDFNSTYGQFNATALNEDTDNITLTFDQGYENGYTSGILDTLKEKNVKAVFFITKQFYDSNPELIQRMIDEGHILGNHTCLHPSGGYPKYVDANGLQSFVDDVSRLHKLIYDSFGYRMRLFRFPEGESSEQLMAVLQNYGYTSVFWSYAHRDFVMDDQPEVSVTLSRCLSHMGCGAVYLLHAVSSSNTEALADFIDQARAQGYEFGVFPVDEVSKGQ